MVNYFKAAFKKSRENDKDIHKAFGLKHLDDVTNIYVHPDNASVDSKTHVCQIIGESVMLFLELFKSLKDRNERFDDQVFYSDTAKEIYISTPLRNDFKELYKCTASKVVMYFNQSGSRFVAYDEVGNVMQHELFHGHLLIYFVGMLFYDYQYNADIRKSIAAFTSKPTVKNFVVLSENFYQYHKEGNTNNFEYGDIDEGEWEGYISFRSREKVLIENEKKANEEIKIDLLSFDFDHDLDMIPDNVDMYDFPDKLRGIANAIVSGDGIATLFYGPAGTGKSMTIRKLAKVVNLPILATINCTEALDEFILGKYVPEGNSFTFRLSEVGRAIKEGGAVVFEEINMGKPQHLAFLNTLLDGNGIINLDNGEKIYRHKDFRFFATLNYNYYGTRELNQALFNRFTIAVKQDKLSDEAIRKALNNANPDIKPGIVNNMIKVFHQIENKITEMDLVISVRNLESWARLAKHEGFLRASEYTIIPICKGDPMMEESIRSAIKLLKW